MPTTVRAWWAAAALGPMAWGVTQVASPRWVEAHFSSGFGQSVAQALGVVTGPVPFSVAQTGIAALAVAVFGWIGVAFVRTGRAARFKWAAPRAFAITSLGYAVFIGIWGLNYQREPLIGAFGFPSGAPTVRELRGLTAELVTQVNQTRAAAPEDPEGVARLADSVDDAITRAMDAYQRASVKWPFLGGTYSRSKPLFGSVWLSYAGLGGVYIPFTGEPNVNVAVPPSTIPFNVCHEMAHQRGVAREDEANFVGFLVARDYGDPDFAYSALIGGAVYAVNALEKADPAAAEGLWANLGLGARRDLEARRKWREKYETRWQDVGMEVNHSYLRANGIKDGAESYGRIVDLMVAERRTRR